MPDETENKQEEWTRVLPGRNGRPRLVKTMMSSLTPPGLNDCLSDDDMPMLRTKLNAARREIENSRLLSQIISGLQCRLDSRTRACCHGDSNDSSKRPSVLCYGLGNPANDKSALFQLALLDLLIDRLELSREHAHLYDPLFRASAKTLIAELGMQVIPTNEEGMRALDNDRATFVFLPHCAPSLTNNLLYANWSPAVLNKLVVFGNSWRAGFATVGRAVAKANLGYMCALETALDESVVLRGGASEALYSHFEVMAVQSFPADQLKDLDVGVWAMNAKPVYENDVVGEYVRNS